MRSLLVFLFLVSACSSSSSNLDLAPVRWVDMEGTVVSSTEGLEILSEDGVLFALDAVTGEVRRRVEALHYEAPNCGGSAYVAFRHAMLAVGATTGADTSTYAFSPGVAIVQADPVAGAYQWRSMQVPGRACAPGADAYSGPYAAYADRFETTTPERTWALGGLHLERVGRGL